jgi:cation transport regulator ChaC
MEGEVGLDPQVRMKDLGWLESQWWVGYGSLMWEP